MKKIFTVLFLMLTGFIFLTAQKADEPQRWSQPLNTGAYDPNVTNSAPLPQVHDYFNPNQEVRYVRTPNEVLGITPNVRVLPRTNSYQSEVIITRHPLNPLIMFGSSNAISNQGSLFISEGVYVTTNGGVNWFGSDTLTGNPIGNHGGDPAPSIDKNGTFIMTHLGFSTNGMFGNYSTDNGLTWSSNFTIESGSVDKNLGGTDDSPTSPFYGRSYVAYTRFSGSFPAILSYTSNGGVSWSSPSQIIPPASGYIVRGTDVRTARNGDVYVAWANGIGNSGEDFASFAKSTDGGVTFTGSNNIFDMNGLLVFGTGFTPYNIRMNSFPRIDVDRSGGSRDGWIYILVSQKNLAPAGSDPDIVLHRSTDGGTTWSPGIRVNQDPLNNGKYQFYNAIRVDEAGGVNVVYYDNRNTAADSAEVMLSRSLDGGNTWTDAVVSDHRFKPKSVNVSGIATGYAGDYIGVTSGNGKLWPIWMDDITGVMQAWTTAVVIQTFPLNSYNLNSPAPSSRIETLPNNTTNYTFTWDTAASTASYKWIFGSPTTSPRKITLTPNGNTLTVTSGQLDNLLAGLGVAQGDSLVGQWDVWAFRNNPENDSLKATNGPRAITLIRKKPLLTAFNLSSPANNSTILTLVSLPFANNFIWTKSGEAVRYKWLYASPNFSSQSNIKFSLQSGNNGYDSILSVRNSYLDSLAAGIGIVPGDSLVGQWRAYGYSAADSLSSVQTYNLTLKRGIAPTVTTSADSIVVNLPSGQTTSRNLIIGNTGQFSLDWNISEAPSSLDNSKVSFTENELKGMVRQPKGEITRYHGENQTDGQGGPDAGGYRWIDSDEPGGPVFNWVEISATGTPITGWTPNSDDGRVNITLPFPFTYYGNTYNQLKVVTNGWVGFDIAASTVDYLNVAIPNTLEPNNCLYPFWDDIDLSIGGSVYYFHDAPNNRFIVEYKDVPHYSPPGGGPYTFQVILYSDGRILYQYLNMASPVNDATIGNENVGGATGLQVVYNAAYMHNNLAIKIEKGLPWVDEVPNAGTIIPGGNQTVSVNFNTVGLSIGTYTGILKVNSNDPLTPVKNIGVRLNVGTTGVQSTGNTIPTEYDLKQNYPNPFNPVTKINFSIPKQGLVTLKIYDVLGKEVITLVNEAKEAGNYDVDFNASSLASGAYFYKIESGDFSNIKRMILLK